MPGPLLPPGAGPGRGARLLPRSVLGLLGLLLLVGLVTAGAATLLLLGRSSALPSTAATPVVRAAASAAPAWANAVAPRPGETGAATCVDPVADQEWQVTWRAVIGWDPPVTAAPTTAAPTAVSTGVSTAVSSGTPSTSSVPLSGPGAPDVVNVGDPSPDLLPTGFAVRELGPTTPGPGQSVGQPGGWRSQDDQTWRVRWTPTAGQAVAAGPQETFQRDGSLTTLDELTLSVDNSPRYVTPDGACTVYLAPFLASSMAGAPVALAGPVSVVGDDLLTQSAGSNDGSTGQVDDGATTAAEVRARLTAVGRQSELVGQVGARWSLPAELTPGPLPALTPGQTSGPLVAPPPGPVSASGPGPGPASASGFTSGPASGLTTGPPLGSTSGPISPLARADVTEVDEIRGLRSSGALVIALGTQDAQSVASALDRTQARARLDSVLAQIPPVIDELRTGGQCSVLVTVADPWTTRKTTQKPALKPAPAVTRFTAAADRINAELRQGAADPNDRLKLWDWAATADQHRIGTPTPWFTADAALTSDGVTAYANALSHAAALC